MMMHRTLFFRCLAVPAAAGLMFGLAVQSQAATIPYFQDFDSFDVGTNPDGFVINRTSPATESTATFEVAERVSNSGDHQYLGSISQLVVQSSSANPAITTALAFPGAAGTSFTLTTDLYVEEITSTGSGTRIAVAGLGALGNESLGGYTVRWVITDANVTGQLRLQGLAGTLVDQGGAPVTRIDSSTNMAPIVGRLYTMTLVGTYNESGHLTLEASVVDTVSLESVTAASGVIPSPATGDYFGYRIGLGTSNNSTVSTQISFDNFSLVPEPGSLALLGLGGLLMMRRMRRTHQTHQTR